MSAKGQSDFLTFAWHFAGGGNGRDESPYNPIARATRRLLQDGQPFERMTFSFFQSNGSPLTWIGAFVHSAGDRVLFFPGFANTHAGVEKHNGSLLTTSPAFEVDHVSLERDRKSWHLTSKNRKSYENVPSTTDLGQSRTLWFGLSISSLDVLRVLKQETTVQSGAPSSDASRRASVISESLKLAQHNIVQLDTGYTHTLDQGFLHLWFVVGPPGFPDYNGPHFGFPFLVRRPEWEREHLPIRSHRIRLSETVDIQVAAMLIPGIFKIPVAFCTPAR
jgi:hypothetical protein